VRENNVRAIDNDFDSIHQCFFLIFLAKVNVL